MITIEKSENFRGSQRPCTVCCSTEDVYNVTFHYEDTNSGLQIALCRQCLKELTNKINEVLSD